MSSFDQQAFTKFWDENEPADDRRPDSWGEQINALTEQMEQSRGDEVREAIAHYLKKSKAVIARSCPDNLEQGLNRLPPLVAY